MSKFEFKIKLLISGLLTLTALLIVILIFFSPDDSVKITDEYLTENDLKVQAEEEISLNKNNAGSSNTALTSIPIPALPPAPDPVPMSDKNIYKAAAVKKAEKKEKSLYFIIDDAGYSLEKLKPFLDFPGNLTIAVLPGLEYSRQSAELALAKGKKVILHQPMDAINRNNTGPFAIKTGMDEKTITDILEKNINSLPGITGVNNHMGSAVTSDERMMDIILKYLQKHSLLFIDSLTTAESVCKKSAAKISFTIAQRDIFLDNVDNREGIMESLNTGRATAENKGYAVMIGHVWSSELADTMMQIYPNLIEEGFSLKDASEFLLGEE
ncbi:MAG: divergent polysaccharide deacetylase family protein [Spirochaetia bacterium]|nr:divergent polysaccharide deacetylase family protein [Spirochaetia bacterium]